MSTLELTRPADMAGRGASHIALRAELDRQGLLHADERELLLDAADALLFGEPEAPLRRLQASDLLESLVANDRRTPTEAGRLLAALDGCGCDLAVT